MKYTSMDEILGATVRIGNSYYLLVKDREDTYGMKYISSGHVYKDAQYTIPYLNNKIKNRDWIISGTKSVSYEIY